MPSSSTPRVAFVSPSCSQGHYLQPVLGKLARRFPSLTVFTGRWPGFIAGCENAFHIHKIKGIRRIRLRHNERGVDDTSTWVSPALLRPVLRHRPDVAFVVGLNLVSEAVAGRQNHCALERDLTLHCASGSACPAEDPALAGAPGGLGFDQYGGGSRLRPPTARTAGRSGPPRSVSVWNAPSVRRPRARTQDRGGMSTPGLSFGRVHGKAQGNP